MADELILILLGFSLPLGSGMQNTFPVDISKCFPLIALVAIARAIRRTDSKGYPRTMWAFLLFALVHTLIVYGLIFPEEFSLTSLGSVNLGSGFFREMEGNGIKVIRFFLFAATGWAFSRLWTPRAGAAFTYALFAGLLLTVCLGGYSTHEVLYSGYEERISAGFLDANAFGLTSLCCLCFIVMTLAAKRDRAFRLFSLIAVPSSCMFLAMSGSRGCLLGAVIGALSLVKGRRKLQWLFGIVAALTLAVFLLGRYFPAFTDTLEARLSPARLLEDNGSGRTYIWLDYVHQIKGYWLLGVGAERSMSVISDGYAYKIAVCHNTFLGVLVEYGLVGFALFVIALTEIVRGICRISLPLRKASLAIIAAWAAQALFLDSLSLRDSWLIVGLCSAAASFAREAAATRSDRSLSAVYLPHESQHGAPHVAPGIATL